MTHFEKTVSAEIKTKLKEFAELVKDEFISDLLRHEHNAQGDGILNEISGVSGPGFIPLQRGGFEVHDFYFTNGDAITEKEEILQVGIHKECLEMFCEDNKIDQCEYSKLTEKQQEQFQEYEQDHGEPSLLRAEMWIEKESTIFFRLSLGYRDAPYYRTRHDETLNDITFTEKEFMLIDNKEIAKELFTIKSF